MRFKSIKKYLEANLSFIYLTEPNQILKYIILGTLFCNMKPLDVDPLAEDKDLAKKMVAVSSYWSGLIDKQDLIKQAKSAN